MKKIILSSLLIALLTACSSTPVQESPPARVEDRSARPPGDTGPQARPTPPQQGTMNPLKDPSNILSKRSVYFDYDDFSVKDEYRPLVQAHARYLTQTNSARMTVQGNTDERGSREYNLALGQKRADAVKRAMTVLGAGERQIDTVSFGEEKPKAPGQDESAWAQNRRADIVYQGE